MNNLIKKVWKKVYRHKTKFIGDHHKHRSLLKCLVDCNKGEELEVIAIRAGYRAKQRLAHLGVFPGTKIIKKKSAPWHGPIEIIVRGTTLVIGRGLASKIIVQCHDNCIY